MGRGSAVILAIAIVIASLIFGAFNRYEISTIGAYAIAFRIDKLTGHVAYVRGSTLTHVSEERE